MNWGANTVSHIHLHRPLFRGPTANRLFSAYLSVLLAVPQRWWKLRHLRHHGLVEPGDRAMRLGAEGISRSRWCSAAVGLLAATARRRLLGVVLPALAVGFGLCALQGHAEHARAAAASTTTAASTTASGSTTDSTRPTTAPRAPTGGASPRIARRTTVSAGLPPALRWAESLFAVANRASRRRAGLARACHAGHAARAAPSVARAWRGVRGVAGARRADADPIRDGDRRRAVPAHHPGAGAAAAPRAVHDRRSGGGAPRCRRSSRSPTPDWRRA